MMNGYTYEGLMALLHPTGTWGFTAPPTMRLRECLIANGATELAAVIAFTAPVDMGDGAIIGLGAVPTRHLSPDELRVIRSAAEVVCNELLALRGEPPVRLSLVIDARCGGGPDQGNQICPN